MISEFIIPSPEHRCLLKSRLMRWRAPFQIQANTSSIARRSQRIHLPVNRTQWSWAVKSARITWIQRFHGPKSSPSTCVFAMPSRIAVQRESMILTHTSPFTNFVMAVPDCAKLHRRYTVSCSCTCSSSNTLVNSLANRACAFGKKSNICGSSSLMHDLNFHERSR